MLSSYDKWHWRVFNIGCRLFGLLAMLNGTIFTIWGIALLLSPQSTIDVEGVPTAALGPKLGMLAIGLLTLVLGVMVVRARTYRPDLGDVSWLIQPQVARGQLRSRRNWWTGDRKGSSGKAAA